jgi:hypothetical protein
MNAIVPQGFGTVSQRALQALSGTRKLNDEWADGISLGFAVLSYRGKTWKVKYQGVERTMMRVVDGIEEPRTSLELVLIKRGVGMAKNYYASGYVEGSNEKPDCFSANGQKPDPASPNPQHTVCKLCKWDQFNSRPSADGQGGKGKACSDNIRIAVVPGSNIDNEPLGGPMLLRVPAASLKELGLYARKMEQAGFPLAAISTRISFDPSVAYPKLVFGAVRALTDEEVEKVLALREDARVAAILNESVEYDDAPHAAAPAPAEQLFEQPPAQPLSPKMQQALQQELAPKPAPAPQPAPAPKPAPAPAPKPAPAPVVEEASFTEVAPAAPAAAPSTPAAEAAPTGVADFDALLNDLCPL